MSLLAPEIEIDSSNGDELQRWKFEVHFHTFYLSAGPKTIIEELRDKLSESDHYFQVATFICLSP